MIYQKKKGGFIVAGYGFYDAHRIHQKTQSEPADTRERLAVSSCHMQIIETILFFDFPSSFRFPDYGYSRQKR